MRYNLRQPFGQLGVSVRVANGRISMVRDAGNLESKRAGSQLGMGLLDRVGE